MENQLVEIQSTLKNAPLRQKTTEAANTGTDCSCMLKRQTQSLSKVDDQRIEQRQNPTVAQR